jgi:hypothetical protein
MKNHTKRRSKKCSAISVGFYHFIRFASSFIVVTYIPFDRRRRSAARAPSPPAAPCRPCRHRRARPSRLVKGSGATTTRRREGGIVPAWEERQDKMHWRGGMGRSGRLREAAVACATKLTRRPLPSAMGEAGGSRAAVPTVAALDIAPRTKQNWEHPLAMAEHKMALFLQGEGFTSTKQRVLASGSMYVGRKGYLRRIIKITFIPHAPIAYSRGGWLLCWLRTGRCSRSFRATTVFSGGCWRRVCTTSACEWTWKIRSRGAFPSCRTRSAVAPTTMPGE